MAETGINAVRVYTVPPRWLLDIAQEHGLRVMVGLAMGSARCLPSDAASAAEIVRRVRDGVRRCAGHPALLCYAVGNEIPARSFAGTAGGVSNVSSARLYRTAKTEDPDALVTYVNFPRPSICTLPFLDFVCFNVYLESRDGSRPISRGCRIWQASGHW